LPSVAASQGALARLEDLRGTEARNACFATKSTSAGSQSLTRFRSGTVGQPWPRDSVIQANDRVVIVPQTDARIRVDSALARGTVYLAPEIGRCPGSELGRHIVRRAEPTGSGSYEFKKDTLGRGSAGKERFVVAIKNGAAVVQWQSGQLLVRALDEQIRDLGGVLFTVVVDSAANRGIVSVHEGAITMRNGALRASAGQSFTFGAGQQPQSVIVREAGLDEIRFHSDVVWRKPRSVLSFVPRPPRPRVPGLPWRYIVPGTIGVSALGYAAYKVWGEQGPPPAPPVKAIVVITIPL
jgi:hypothetical protein